MRIVRTLYRVVAVSVGLVASAQEARSIDFERAVEPLLATHCAACHEGPAPEADFTLPEPAPGPPRTTAWRLVRERLARGEMPPPKRPRPTAGELELLLEWIDAVHPAASAPAPPPTLRRLNRAEYENTVRDLTGVFINAHERLPADEVGGSFDNIGDVLSMSDGLLELYLASAEDIAERALPYRAAGELHTLSFGPEELSGGSGAYGGLRHLSRASSVHFQVDLEYGGEHTLRARVTASQAGPDLARIGFEVDGERFAEAEIEVDRPELALYEATVDIGPGRHSLGVAFLNDYYAPDDPDPDQRDRNVHVAAIELVPPQRPVEPTPLLERLLDEREPWRERLAALATTAWRHPPQPEELDRLAVLFEDSAQAETPPTLAWRQVLTALLVSPRFLFRVEEDRPDGSLDDHELAVRLAYFLWSTMPDEELLALADRGELAKPDELSRQVQRMARSARATAFIENFVAQWLQLGNFDEATPHPKLYPEFDTTLAAAMRAETLMLMEALLFEDRDVRLMLDPGFTFLNEELAAHYGIEGVRGERMRRVQLVDRRRGGIAMHASILTATSDPGRTSPVKRGKWILEVLLDAAPPPPPPGVVPLPEGNDVGQGTVRERLERHREDPACASCHSTMDALGFGLENFDAIGAWRTNEAGLAIDASAELPDGRRFDGPRELAEILGADGRFVRALMSQLVTYAVGRELVPADEATIDRLLAKLPAGPTWIDMIEAIVLDEVFRKRSDGQPR